MPPSPSLSLPNSNGGNRSASGSPETVYSSSPSSVERYERDMVRRRMSLSGHWYIGFFCDTFGAQHKEKNEDYEKRFTNSNIRGRARSILSVKSTSGVGDAKARLGGNEKLHNPCISHFSFTPREVIMDDVTVFGMRSGDDSVEESGIKSKMPFQPKSVPDETSDDDYCKTVNEVGFAIIKGTAHYSLVNDDSAYHMDRANHSQICLKWPDTVTRSATRDLVIRIYHNR